MNLITNLFIRIREHRAQSMAEYALILAAIAVVGIAAYGLLGGAIVAKVQSVTSDL